MRTSFIIVEVFNVIFASFEDLSPEAEQCSELCSTLKDFLQAQDDFDIEAITSVAKICSVLWTFVCHVPSFRQISAMYLSSSSTEEDSPRNSVILSCLRHFLNLHSSRILSQPEMLQCPIISQIVHTVLNLS